MFSYSQMTTRNQSYNVAPNPNDNVAERLPVGTMVMWISPTAPPGWLLCDGLAISRNTFAGLYAEIGNTYGPGDGLSTFNIPNLQQRIAMGFENGTNTMGDTGGFPSILLQLNDLPPHSHSIVDAGNAQGHRHNYDHYGLNGSSGLNEFERNDPLMFDTTFVTDIAVTNLEVEFSVLNAGGQVFVQTSTPCQNPFLVVSYIIKGF